jgi:hypothetical protein
MGKHGHVALVRINNYNLSYKILCISRKQQVYDNKLSGKVYENKLKTVYGHTICYLHKLFQLLT